MNYDILDFDLNLNCDGGNFYRFKFKLWWSDYLVMFEIYELDIYMYLFLCYDEVDMILFIF